MEKLDGRVFHEWQRFSQVTIKEIFMGKWLCLEFHNGVKSFLWNQFRLSQWNIQTRQGLLCAIPENKTNDCQTYFVIIQYTDIYKQLHANIRDAYPWMQKYSNSNFTCLSEIYDLPWLCFDCGNLMQDLLLTCFNGLLRNLCVPPLNDVLKCFHESGTESANNACQ